MNELRPMVWLGREDNGTDELRAGVERMLNEHTRSHKHQIAMAEIGILRQLKRARNHPLRWQFRRAFRENIIVQLALWNLAYTQLTGREFGIDDHLAELDAG